MSHSKDQVIPGPSTSTSPSDSNKMAGKQIYSFALLSFFMLHLYIQIMRKESEMC